MAYVVKKEHHFSWKVIVRVPADGGKFDEQPFTATFKALRQDELNRLLQSVNADYELARACLVGWEGIKGEDGKSVAYNDEEAANLCAVPYVRTAVTETYLKALAGLPGKN